MGTIIAASSSDSQVRYFDVRTLYATVGEDEAGVLCSPCSNSPYLAVFSGTRSSFVQALAPQLALNGKPFPLHEVRALTEVTAIETDSYSFELYPVSTTAELLSQGNVSAEEIIAVAEHRERLPELCIQLGELEKRYPVPERFPITLGSASLCEVILDIPQIQDRHCTVTNLGDSVRIAPLSGHLLLNQVELAEPFEIKETVRVGLPPGSFEFLLRFPTDKISGR